MYRITLHFANRKVIHKQATPIQYYYWEEKKKRVIIEWHGLERDPKDHLVPSPCHGQVLGP